MQRNFQTKAIIFSVKPQGENNSTVKLFTKEGLVYATLYGGPKSRLRPRVSLWNSGNVWLYKNEQNGSIKISDFDVKNYHLSFRTDLYKNFAASLAAEIVIKTKAAGSAEKCFYLINGFLDGLEIANTKNVPSGLIRFLWRYLELLGVQPETQKCTVCTRDFKNIIENNLAAYHDSDFADDAKIAAYQISENGFVCMDCFLQNQIGLPYVSTYKNTYASTHTNRNTIDNFFATSEELFYLSAVSQMKPSQARELKLSEMAENKLKNFLFFLTEQAISSKLKTLESAKGIL